MVPGIQEHENRAQLSPGKGYLIGNESEILGNSNADFTKGKQIRLSLELLVVRPGKVAYSNGCEARPGRSSQPPGSESLNR